MTQGRAADESGAALEKLAAAVLRRRKKAGITQEEAAYLSGVALRTFQNLERGTLNPSYLTLRRVAQGLGVSLRALIPD